MAFLNLAVWQNKRGTSDKRCHCDSWKQHWINGSGLSWPSECSVVGCHNHAEVGAHIYNSYVSMSEYIVPMCKSCNMKNEKFAIDDNVVKVPANVSETCRKKNFQKSAPLLDLSHIVM